MSSMRTGVFTDWGEIMEKVIWKPVPMVSEEYAEKMGRDYAINGANMTNCNFAIFAHPELTKAWERGRDVQSSNNK